MLLYGRIFTSLRIYDWSLLAFHTTVALGLQAACVPGLVRWCADTGTRCGPLAGLAWFCSWQGGSGGETGVTAHLLFWGGFLLDWEASSLRMA